MALDAREISILRRIIVLAEKLIDESPKPQRSRPVLSRGNGSGKKGAKGKRMSTNWKDLVQFRKMLKAERKRGVSVADLARKHGISPAYIYLLP